MRDESPNQRRGRRNRVNGARFERRVLADLEERGWGVLRAAGSHGTYDVIATKPGQMLKVQCKRTWRISAREWDALFAECLAHGGRPIVAFMPGRTGIEYRVLQHSTALRDETPWARFVP